MLKRSPRAVNLPWREPVGEWHLPLPRGPVTICDRRTRIPFHLDLLIQSPSTALTDRCHRLQSRALRMIRAQASSLPKERRFPTAEEKTNASNASPASKDGRFARTVSRRLETAAPWDEPHRQDACAPS